MQVAGRANYWQYLEETFVPSLYAGTHYNGAEDPLSAQQKLITDRSHVLLGTARLRQVRVEKGETKSYIFSCLYSFLIVSDLMKIACL